MKYFVIGFASTSDAMAMEYFCKKNKVPGRLLANPKELSTSCGLAWKFEGDYASEAELEGFLRANNLAWEKMILLDF